MHIFCLSFNPLQNLAMSSSPLRGGQSRCSKVTSTPPGDTTFSSFKLFLKPGSLPRLSKANVSYDEVSIGQNGSPLAVIQTVALRGCPRTDVFSDIAYEVRMILKHAYHKVGYSYSIMVLARKYPQWTDPIAVGPTPGAPVNDRRSKTSYLFSRALVFISFHVYQPRYTPCTTHRHGSNSPSADQISRTPAPCSPPTPTKLGGCSQYMLPTPGSVRRSKSQRRCNVFRERDEGDRSHQA